MNDTERYTVVYTVNGKLNAEMIKAFLESEGVKVMISQESAGGTYGLTIGPLGEVEILVPEAEESHARQLLSDMEKGKYELDSSDSSDDLLEDE